MIMQTESSFLTLKAAVDKNKSNLTTGQLVTGSYFWDCFYPLLFLWSRICFISWGGLYDMEDSGPDT